MQPAPPQRAGDRVGARSRGNNTHPEYRTILAIDIERYGRLDRTDPARVALRRRLAHWSTVLLARSGAASHQWVQQDTGDGWIVSVDPRVPRDLLLTTVMAGLRRRLAAFNRGKSEAKRLRLRLVVHAGEVLRDPDPLVGEATTHACRLLDSQVLRACLQATAQPLAVIVSMVLYEGIIKHGYGGLDPAAWHPVVAHLKEGPAPRGSTSLVIRMPRSAPASLLPAPPPSPHSARCRGRCWSGSP